MRGVSLRIYGRRGIVKKRILSAFLCFFLLFALIPSRAFAVGTPVTCAYDPESSTRWVLTVTSHRSVKARAEYDTQVRVSVEHNVITVAGRGGYVGTANVFIVVNGSEYTVQVPIGYTTFRFCGDGITVFPGSSDAYEIIGERSDGEICAETGMANGTGMDYRGGGGFGLRVDLKEEGGTFAFSGKGENMSVSVTAGMTRGTTLLLAGLDLTSEMTAPITVWNGNGEDTSITSLRGTENALTDSPKNHAESNPDNCLAESAVIKGKAAAKLLLNGAGTLKLNCLSRDAVKVDQKGSLTVTDVAMTITSAGNGLSSDNRIMIRSGEINAEVAGSAVCSCPDTVSISGGTAGTVLVEDGIFRLNTGNNALQAASRLTVKGGAFSITAGKGKAARNENARGVAAIDPDGGETAETALILAGGTFSIDAAGDAVYSDGKLSVSGGAYAVASGGSGITAGGTLHIGSENSDSLYPLISVSNSTTGFVGSDVFIHSGTVKITAAADGVLASDGNSEAENTVSVSGGDLYVNAGGNGVNAGKKLTFSGGRSVIWGQEAEGDGAPIKCGGTPSVLGGTVFCAGSGKKAETPVTGSGQMLLEKRTPEAFFGDMLSVMNGSMVEFAMAPLKKADYVMYSWTGDSDDGWSIGIGPEVQATYPAGCIHVPDYTEEMTVKQTPSCETGGEGTLPCLFCGRSTDVQIPAHGHCFSCEIMTPPYEWRPGTLVVSCALCDIGKKVELPRINGEDYSYNEATAFYRWLNTAYGVIEFSRFGDVDGNGKFMLEDICSIFMWWNGKQQLPEAALSRGDANDDGVTDLKDAAKMYGIIIMKA